MGNTGERGGEGSGGTNGAGIKKMTNEGNEMLLWGRGASIGPGRKSRGGEGRVPQRKHSEMGKFVGRELHR